MQPSVEPLLDFDPRRLFTDPQALRDELRVGPAVRRVREASGFEYWLITRYREARQALLDGRLSNDPRRTGFPFDEQNDLSPLANSDPPDHDRLRALVSGVFTRGRIAALAPAARRITDELLDAMAPLGRANLIPALALPLPLLVIAELIGIPTEDRTAFRRWADTMLSEHGPATKRERSRRLRAYFVRLADRRRATVDRAVPPAEQPDLLSALIAAQHGPDDRTDVLTDDELIGLLVLFLVAGHETTTNLIGNGLLCLSRRPDQLALLRAQPELAPSAVQELLRFEGSAGQAAIRVASEDLVIAGTEICAGEVVNIALAIANRDPEVFPDPDRLDITRSPNQHLAFGHGIHYCLGAPLARMLAAVALGALLRRFPDLVVGEPADEVRWRQISITFGLVGLPVSFTPTPAPTAA
ncbi:cytochrome P450 [Streptomyces sp. NPDC090021]|uniref:cytochrome P450 family protein n=1 Tax=Streptomyces sp. NPDC090021 TaxID=3365919 RepID=UPI00382CD1D8